jgi:GSH-dependent disulfide-bond oxidoreductase
MKFVSTLHSTRLTSVVVLNKFKSLLAPTYCTTSMADNSDKPKAAGTFASINAATSGARTQRELPSGKHPIQLYSMATPNGQKISIALEELGAKYDAFLINIMQGDQFTSGFVEINPNSKIPALIDREGPGGKPTRIFESGSILLYLAEKFGKLLPTDPSLRVEALNWLFFQVGAGPYFGQFGHFYK